MLILCLKILQTKKNKAKPNKKMIKKLLYNQINYTKYKKCIEESFQKSDFADPDFLNEVSNQKWGILIQGDYEVVMPFTWKKKWGIKYIVMPELCPYLGIFSKEDDPNINKKFHQYFIKNFTILYYAFHYKNNFNFYLKKRKSQYLLQENYFDIFKNYSSSRKRNIKNFETNQDLIQFNKNQKIYKDIHSFFIKNLKNLSEKQKNKYLKLCEKLSEKKLTKIYTLSFQNELQSAAILYSGKKNLHLSLFANDKKLKNKNLPSIFIDKILQENIELQNFDFMGSNIESIANFNARFGAKYYEYPYILNTKEKIFYDFSKKILNLYLNLTFPLFSIINQKKDKNEK